MRLFFYIWKKVLIIISMLNNTQGDFELSPMTMIRFITNLDHLYRIIGDLLELDGNSVTNS
ncbi:uncharacterized protein Smp_202660 [Schistosoma mansoni]|uniref:Smp_202660 n=1 Tax=Schistosoma mansoni TaxID=6183 RepID=G4VIU2_SCHMA|nr:uncharacterized protein Smp_202660 [Schistosoma mansoni]|eukprot:XP_018651948.1 uncharacterized protein Smp_202660 [Schistosoma mansoni]